MLADEAAFEGQLREAASRARFCAACSDLVRGARCDACGAAVAPGGYTVERVLVSNAHGRMYVARDADGKRVALKELAFVQPPSLATIAAFEREATFLRALEHPAIPRFVASFREGDGVHVRYYLAQELVVGEALDAHLDEHFYTEAEVVDIARQVLAVLVYLQSLSPMVIHRDIKPANLITRGDGTIAVVDFGAAYVQGSTVGSTTIGTFGYMPVEQLAGIIDATTDLYALGSTLLHLLTRQEPWRLMQSADVAVANVSRSTLAFLRKLTAPDAKGRFSSAAAALAALDGKSREHRRRVLGSRRAVVVASTLAAVATAGGVGAYAMLHTGDASQVDDSSGHMIYVAMSGFSARMCQCDDRTCAAQVTEDLQRWTVLVSANPPSGEADADETSKVAEVTKKLTDCKARIYLVDAAIPHTTQIDVPPRGIRYGDPLPPGKTVDMDLAGTPLHDVLRMLAQQCDTSLVVPDNVGDNVTMKLTKLPCDQALDALLDNRMFAYKYDAAAKLLRVGRRASFEHDETSDHAPVRVGDSLPEGHAVDLDYRYADVRNLLAMLAKANKVNVVLPGSVGGGLTLWLHGTSWRAAFEAVLASHDLGYDYRATGRVLRAEPRRELDARAVLESKVKDEAIASTDCQWPGNVNPFDARPVCEFDSSGRRLGPKKKASLDDIALKLSTEPAWATAEIEGFGSCDTPCTLHVPPGTYMVRFRNSEQHLRGKYRVTVSKDESVKKLAVTLEDE
jgi:hypothetical protein